MKTLKECAISCMEREERFKTSPKVTSMWMDRLKYDNLIFAIYSLYEEQDLNKAKQYFYNYGLLDAFDIREFNSNQFTYDLHSIGYAMLSDNLSFVREDYANLSFTDFYIDENTEDTIYRTMEEHVLDGDDGCVFVHTMQQFLLGNEDLVRRNIEIIERVRLGPKNKNNSKQYDVNFFKGLLDRDKSRCEAILNDMVSPKIHQRRNIDPLLKKYVSMPALGYAKLAWILGVEVEVKSKLIPKELLPIRPLDHYDIPYEFLK